MDIPVLKYLDVFIGLAFVMVLGCSVVAAVTHVISSMLYLRAQYLRQGLTDLIQRLDPEAPADLCKYAAQLVQRHPLVGRPATNMGKATSWFRSLLGKRMAWMPSGSPASVVQRHEFVRILLEWAAGEGPLASEPKIGHLSERIRAALDKCGVSAPLETLRALRVQTTAQERAFPDRAAHLWHTAAAIDACPADFIGQVHTWYDSMTTRTSQRFGLQAKILGSLVALGVALALPLDSIALVKRLSVDEALRKELVDKSQTYKVEDPKLDATAMLELPKVPRTSEGYKDHLAGLMLSWVLLSLGAPFWYDALKDALKLRSVLAQKDEKDKTERQRADTNLTPSAQPATAAGVIAVSAQPVVDDEAGDLETAVG